MRLFLIGAFASLMLLSTLGCTDKCTYTCDNGYQASFETGDLAFCSATCDSICQAAGQSCVISVIESK